MATVTAGMQQFLTPARKAKAAAVHDQLVPVQDVLEQIARQIAVLRGEPLGGELFGRAALHVDAAWRAVGFALASLTTDY